MDVNGTRYFAMLGRPDFEEALANPNLSWGSARQELTLAPLAFSFPESPLNRKPRMEDRRGAAADQYGNIYFISDSQTEILVRNSGSRNTTHFWSAIDVAPPAQPEGSFQPVVSNPLTEVLTFSGLAVTCAHFLVVGAVELNGLLVFDLHHGGAPRLVSAPAPLTVWDLAPALGGGVWILDRSRLSLWATDRNFDFLTLDTAVAPHLPVAPTFAPLAGPAIVEPPALPPSPLPFKSDVVSIDVLPDGTVLVLETDKAQASSRIFLVQGNVVQRYKVAPEALTLAGIGTLLEASAKPGFHLYGQDLAVSVNTNADSSWTARLYVVATDGDQAFGFDIAVEQGKIALTTVPQFFPMRLYGGKAIFGTGPSVYYDSRTEWVPLVKQQICRFATTAIFRSPVFDSRLPNCRWHRLILDAAVSAGANISVRSRCAASQAELATVPFETEPQPYRRARGTELPYQDQPIDSWELLIQNARGRYFQLEFTFTGDGRATPRLRAVRAYYPRFSYLEKYLPRVYQEDATSSLFLDRFLANFEGIYTAIEDRIASVQYRFDPATAPAADLDYLASWIGVTLDPSWSESTQRLFLQNATQFIRARGTRRGIMMALRLALDPAPTQNLFDDPEGSATGIRIIEEFTTSRTSPLAPAGEDLQLPFTLREDRWSPAQGATELHRLYRDALGSNSPAVTYPLSRPTDVNTAAVWERISLLTLGFLPSVAYSDGFSWREFLHRRYSDIDSLNATWRVAFTTFADVPVAVVVPSDTRILTDWFDFQSIVLPAIAAAHRFTVYLPVGAAEAGSQPVQEAKRDLARRIVTQEKPAHTTFRVEFYWTFFRLGDARLGFDTVLDLGSRSPYLMTPALLGQSFIASSYLSPNYPDNLTYRTVLGRGGCEPDSGFKEEIS